MDRGNCETDRRQNFNLSTVYETPQFSNLRMRALGTGWKVSGIVRILSGSHLTVTNGLDRALDGYPSRQRPDLVLIDPYAPNKSTNQWLNPAAFAQPALGTYGNSARNAYDGPGFRTIDLGLVRQFGLPGNRRIEARVEAFNALNWFLLGNPVVNLSAANFGRITTFSNITDPRVMQFAMKYEF